MITWKEAIEIVDNAVTEILKRNSALKEFSWSRAHCAIDRERKHGNLISYNPSEDTICLWGETKSGQPIASRVDFSKREIDFLPKVKLHFQVEVKMEAAAASIRELIKKKEEAEAGR